MKRDYRLNCLPLAVFILACLISAGIPYPAHRALATDQTGASVPPMVEFSPNLEGQVERIHLPTALPEEVWTLTTKGEAAPLGAFTYVANVRVHFGLDGKPLGLTDGMGVFTGVDKKGKPTGHAIYFTLNGIFQPATSAKPNVYPFDAVYIVIGGAGKFQGAIGSGRIKGTANPQNNTFVGAWDATKPPKTG